MDHDADEHRKNDKCNRIVADLACDDIGSSDSCGTDRNYSKGNRSGR